MISPYVIGAFAEPRGTFRVAAGRYTGVTGSAVTVTCGFQPQAIFVKSISAGASDDPVVCFFNMGGSGATGGCSTWEPPTIPSLGPIRVTGTGASAGFSLDSGSAITNTGGGTYQYVALRGNVGTEVWTGTYTGDGADNRYIGSTGGANFVMLIRRVTANGISYRFSSETGDASFNSTMSASAEVANFIQELGASGATYTFQVGTAAHVNGATRVIDWIAVKVPLKGGTVGSYVGTGSSGATMSLSPWTFNADAVIIKGGTATAPIIAVRDFEDSSSVFSNSAVNQNSRIQRMPAGQIQVGSNVQVNQSGVTYHFLALTDT